MTDLKCAVIGCGVIGSTHAWGITNDQQAEIKYFCDILPERAQKLAEKYQCQFSTDWKEILKDPEVNIISIALPHYLHASVFNAALKVGKHVICEKPLCTTPTDLYKMIEVSKNSSKVSACIFQHRFSAPLKTLQRFIALGELGTIQSAHAELACSRTQKYYNADEWRGTWDMEGGGVMINQAIHTFDYLSVFLGRAKSLNAKVEHRQIEGIEVEDYGSGTISYNNNVQATFKAINDPKKKWDVSFSLTGSETTVIVNDHSITCDNEVKQSIIDTIHEEEKKTQAQTLNAPGKECYGGLHNFAFSDFFQCIENGHTPIVNIESASYTNEIILGAYHSTSTNKEVTFPLQDYIQPTLV